LPKPWAYHTYFGGNSNLKFQAGIQFYGGAETRPFLHEKLDFWQLPGSAVFARHQLLGIGVTDGHFLLDIPVNELAQPLGHIG
jgi:hypothetical protein